MFSGFSPLYSPAYAPSRLCRVVLIINNFLISCRRFPACMSVHDDFGDGFGSTLLCRRDGDTKVACILHAHLLLLFKNLGVDDVNKTVASVVLSAQVQCSTLGNGDVLYLEVPRMCLSAVSKVTSVVRSAQGKLLYQHVFIR